MPSKPRRPRGSDDTKPSAADEAERELERAEADVAGGDKEDPAPEVLTQTEEPPQEEAPAPRGARRRRGGAQLRVVASGTAEDVRESLGEFGRSAPEGAPEEPAPEEEEEELDENVERFMKLLSSAKYFVTVSRELPTRHLGFNCAGKLPNARYNCPMTFDDIKRDIFDRFGGSSFNFYIHPRKPNGELTIVEAVQVRNSESDIPLLEGREIGVPIIEPTDETAEPAMAEEDNDPLRRLDAIMEGEIKSRERVMKLKSSRRIMKTLAEEDDDQPSARGGGEVESLKKQLADLTIEQRMQRQIDASRAEQKQFNERILQAIEGMTGGKKGGDNNALLIAMMQSADTKFTTMMTTFMPLIANQGKKHDDLDSMLDRLAKLKSALGEGNPRVKSIEDKLMNLALDRLVDGDDGVGGESGVADVAKAAIKELAPAVKALVDNKTAPAGPTRDEFQRAVVLEAQRISQTPKFQEELTKALAAKGLIIKGDGLAAPAVPPKIEDKTQKKPADAPPKEKEDVEVLNGEDVEPPPGPQSEAYNRKLAVNFVLDTIIREMVTQRLDGYSVGDIIDRLDEEILRGLLDVSDAESLKRLIGSHCDPAKLEAITNAAKSDHKIEEWLQSVILGAKTTYRKALEEAEKERLEQAKKG